MGFGARKLVLGNWGQKTQMSSEVKIFFQVGTLALKTILGPIGPKAFGKNLYKPLVQNLSSNFQKYGPRLTRIIRSIQ